MIKLAIVFLLGIKVGAWIAFALISWLGKNPEMAADKPND
jgi:hypothetical protein